jgi:hypothetical protein
MRVAFLPTGKTEWHGLPAAFGRLFPEHAFEVIPSEVEVADHGEDYPLDGFTSNPLAARHADKPPGHATDLIERAARAVMDADGPDFVFILDDLELANRTQPDHVVRVFRAAVEQHLADDEYPRRARARSKIAEHVSFHLIVPMIEAWFFGDRGALAAAGVAATAQASLAGSSLEDFLTDDASYLVATEADCPTWRTRQDKKSRPKWLGAERERHPKGYLQWLCRDPDDERCTSYTETGGGAAALRRLDWDAVKTHEGLHFMNALIEDVAYAVDEHFTVLPGSSAVATSLARRPKDNVLRNL